MGEFEESEGCSNDDKIEINFEDDDCKFILSSFF